MLFDGWPDLPRQETHAGKHRSAEVAVSPESAQISLDLLHKLRCSIAATELHKLSCQCMQEEVFVAAFLSSEMSIARLYFMVVSCKLRSCLTLNNFVLPATLYAVLPAQVAKVFVENLKRGLGAHRGTAA